MKCGMFQTPHNLALELFGIAHDGSGREAWSPECPCGIDNFGQLVIRAAEPWAADITLDVPPDVWLNATLQNVAPMKQPQCLPQLI